MEYTYKGLKNIVREAERKLKAGTLDMEQAQIAAAAAHASDLIEIGLAVRAPLDLTIMCEDNIIRCLLQAHRNNMLKKKSIDESRTDLVKKLGGYELFAIMNSINNCIEGKIAKIVVLRNVLSPEAKLVIDATPDPGKSPCRFQESKHAASSIA